MGRVEETRRLARSSCPKDRIYPQAFYKNKMFLRRNKK